MTGAEIVFRERLTPRAFVFVIVEAFVAMVGIAYGAPFGARVGWIVFIGASILAIWALLASSPAIEVTATHLRAGAARIERSKIAGVTALDPAAFTLGRETDARRFSLMRSWRSGSGVLITIDDPDDPHPAWILTTARPADLAAALA
jgi:hypothetical protein